jgi:hypothetical protein
MINTYQVVPQVITADELAIQRNSRRMSIFNVDFLNDDTDEDRELHQTVSRQILNAQNITPREPILSADVQQEPYEPILQMQTDEVDEEEEQPQQEGVDNQLKSEVAQYIATKQILSIHQRFGSYQELLSHQRSESHQELLSHQRSESHQELLSHQRSESHQELLSHQRSGSHMWLSYQRIGFNQKFPNCEGCIHFQMGQREHMEKGGCLADPVDYAENNL